MSEIGNFHDWKAGLEKMTTPEIYAALEKCSLLIAENVTKMGFYLGVLMDRGDDCERFGKLLGFMRRVRDGVLKPELVARLGNHRGSLLLKLSFLPPAEQIAIAEGKRFEVIEGGPSPTKKLIESLDPTLFRQVVDRGHIRTLEEQKAYLLRRQRKNSSQDEGITIGHLLIDKMRRGVMIGRTFIPYDDLKKAMRLLGD